MKMKLCFILMKTDMNTGKYELDTSLFWSGTMENYTATNVLDMYSTMMDQMLKGFASHLNKDRGWRSKEVIDLEVKNYDDKSLRGSSCVDLPESIKGIYGALEAC
jgi:hypothetical protein